MTKSQDYKTNCQFWFDMKNYDKNLDSQKYQCCDFPNLVKISSITLYYFNINPLQYEIKKYKYFSLCSPWKFHQQCVLKVSGVRGQRRLRRQLNAKRIDNQLKFILLGLYKDIQYSTHKWMKCFLLFVS